MSRLYPRGGWVLLPSFKPKKVTIVSAYGSFSTAKEWDKAENGKTYHKDSIYESKEAAIAAGWTKVKEQQADIDTRQTNLDKRKEALVKAEKDIA